MFLVRAVIRSTLTAAPRVTSYRVTVGPRVKPVTSASTLNSVNTLRSEATTASLAALRVLPGPPFSSRSSEGSAYVMSPRSWSCSARGGSAWVGGGALVRSGTDSVPEAAAVVACGCPAAGSEALAGAPAGVVSGTGRSARAVGTGAVSSAPSRSAVIPCVRSATSGEGGIPP